jgi:hypothetical protein
MESVPERGGRGKAPNEVNPRQLPDYPVSTENSKQLRQKSERISAQPSPKTTQTTLVA